MFKIKLSIFIFFVVAANATLAQDTAKANIASQHLLKDTSVYKKGIVAKDSIVFTNSAAPTSSKPDTTSWRYKHDPRIATRRSLILPGWGQAYNHEYWKIPLVYGAISIPAITFIYNNSWYKRTRYAFTVLITNDTAHFNSVYPELLSIVKSGNPNAPLDLQEARNAFRKDRDYSILYFFVAWGLNIVDATVFGHLRGFDISDDISMKMKVQPDYNPFSKTANIGLVFNFSKPQHKTLAFER